MKQVSRAVCLAVVLGSVGALLGCGGTEGASTSQAGEPAATPDTPTLARLTTIARELAMRNGDGGAQARKAVLTTTGVAERLLDTQLEPGDPERPVYLIWMYGNFRRNEAGRPLGYLLIGAVDAKTTAVLHSDVIPGELHPGLPNPEKLRLPEIPLSGDVTAVAPDAETLDRLRQLATTIARNAGEPAPTAEYFVANEQDAESAMGNSGNGNPDQPVYVIVMRGRFESHWSLPDGSGTLPPSRFFVLTVGADDLQIRAQGWRNVAPDTSRLGTPAMLLDS